MATARRSASRRSSKKHPWYHGIRYRSHNWAVEIRVPRKPKRIWIGTYPIAEMAAAAYDVAAFALCGDEDKLNFPADTIAMRYAPASTSPEDVRATANAAADAMRVTVARQRTSTANNPPAATAANDHHRRHQQQQQGVMMSGATVDAASIYVTPQQVVQTGSGEFMDEEAIFEMPQLLRNKAAGITMSPPSFGPDTSHESPDPSEAEESLWSY